jgi:hypothetical protein
MPDNNTSTSSAEAANPPAPATTGDGSHEVVIPANANLPESIEVNLDPVVITLDIPASWFRPELQPVIVFEHANFGGKAQSLAVGAYDEVSKLLIGNDTISSLKVPPGLVVRLYEHWHFEGQFIDVKGDLMYVGDAWNDRASSIIVYEESKGPPTVR